MIENIRKYNVLIIIGLVVVAIALVIGLQDNTMRRHSGGQPYIKLAGKTYDDREYQHYGVNTMELIQSIARSGDFGPFQFMLGLTAKATTQDEASQQFFIGRMLIRQAKSEFGVYPGNEQISDYIRSLRTFVGADQKFSAENYQRFIDKGIGRLGMTENDLRELVSDILASEKIAAIVGAGMIPQPDAVTSNLALSNQEITGEIASLDIQPFKASIQPTDEELKAYWELIQESFQTEPLRKFTYIITSPVTPAETPADAAITDNDKAVTDADKAAAKAKKDAEIADAQRAKQLAIDTIVDDFTFTLGEQKGEGFEALAKNNNWEVKTSELFSQSSPPADLNVKLRSNSKNEMAVDELFKIQITSDPVSKLSPPIAIGDSQWLIARLDAEEPARAKTFEEAKPQALAQYINEKALEALKKSAQETAEKIKASLATGKSFNEAAKEAGIETTSSFNKINSSHTADPLTQPASLFTAARNVDPKSIAEPVVQADATYVVYVAERTVTQKPDQAASEQTALATAGRSNANYTFTDWLKSRTEAANVVKLFRSE